MKQPRNVHFLLRWVSPPPLQKLLNSITMYSSQGAIRAQAHSKCYQFTDRLEGTLIT